MTFERRQNDNSIMDLLRDIRTTQLQEAEKHGILRGDLNGITHRIDTMEKSSVRNWWFTVAIVPVLTAVHALVRKLGVNF